MADVCGMLSRTNVKIPQIAGMVAGLFLLIFPSSGAEERLPIISRMQVIYSVVTHYSSISDRVSFYNTQGIPAGNTNYAVPHLVYEPIVTLYNPYNTVLQFFKSRVRLANPPVGFKFKKNADYLRSEWASGDTFYGLGRFNIPNEANPAVQKSLTMVLGGGNPTNYSGVIVLQPGEARTFSVRVETNWTWGLETAGGFNPRSFYDWDTNRDFTNKDGRTNNLMGAESIAGLDYRAGFQSDHLSVATGRPAATRYSFENSQYGGSGWVAIKLTDTFGVEAKGLRTAGNTLVPDFQLSLMRGINVDPASDTAKSFSFNIADLIQPGLGGVGVPTISRSYRASDLLQTPTDSSLGGKLPIAVFTVVAKSKALQQRFFQAVAQPPTNQLYEARIDSLYDFLDPNLQVGPSDRPTSGIVVLGVERVGDFLMLDVVGNFWTYRLWKIKGTTDPGQGFPDDLTATCVIREGPERTGVFKVTIPIAGRGDHYFVRIEQ